MSMNEHPTYKTNDLSVLVCPVFEKNLVHCYVKDRGLTFLVVHKDIKTFLENNKQIQHNAQRWILLWYNDIFTKRRVLCI